jgi:hypothetical protein
MYSITEIKEIAARIKNAETWNEDDCRDLCEAADMLADWEAADGDTFERVVLDAAEKLGVEII